MRTFMVVLAAVMFTAGMACCQVLTDQQLDSITGGAPAGLSVNDTHGNNAAIAAQSNIGITFAGTMMVSSGVDNTNTALVDATNGTGLALQNNVGALAALTGDIDQGNINNSNNSVVTADGDNGVAGGRSLGMTTLLGMNEVEETNSAVSAQSNLGLMLSLGGANGVTNSDISNINGTNVKCVGGNSTVALQDNIGVIFSDMSVVSSGIVNSNNADVKNRYDNGGNVVADSANLMGGAVMVNFVSASSSGIAAQNNIGAVVALSGYVSNVSMTNVNTANVVNKAL